MLRNGSSVVRENIADEVTANGAARETLSRLLDSLNVELSKGLSSDRFDAQCAIQHFKDRSKLGSPKESAMLTRIKSTKLTMLCQSRHQFS